MRSFYWLFVTVILLSACSPNNTNEDGTLEKYFQANSVEGTFALFDNGTGEFTTYNIARYRDSAYLPSSTFEVVMSVIALETGILKDSTSMIPWDSTSQFRALASQIGPDTMQRWLDTIGYGSSRNKPVIKNNTDSFWLDNSVKVTADEQLGLVKKLYFGQLPFQPRSQRIVKNMMLVENNSNYKLSYRTGTGRTDRGTTLGWLIGWIEENRHPYFFVLQTESADQGNITDGASLGILKQILAQYGFLEGKR